MAEDNTYHKRKYKTYLNSAQPKIPRTTAWTWNRMLRHETRISETNTSAIESVCDETVDIFEDDSHTHEPLNNNDHEACSTENNCDVDENGLSSIILNQIIDKDISFDDNDVTDNDSTDDESDDGSCSDTDSTDNNDSYNQSKSTDPKLYENSTLTLSESLMIVMTFAFRNKLSGTTFSNLIKLINLFCPKPNNFPKSSYGVWNYFKDLKTPIIQHFYCGSCLTYAGKDVSDTFCSLCKSSLEDNKRYFIQIPLVNQIQNLFKKPEFIDLLRYKDNSERKQGISDIYDGHLYKKLSSEGYFTSNSCNISLQFNTDGVALIKSTGLSVWPVYFTINELPPSKRYSREYRLFGGLWFDSKKPEFRTYLHPFVKSIIDAYTNGVTITLPNTTTTVKVVILSAVLDAPARCMFQGFTQFNGSNGCGVCLEEGTVVKSGKGHARVYLFNKEHASKLGHADIRDSSSTKKHAIAAYKKRQDGFKKFAVLGVKEISWGLVMPKFDIIRGVPIDYMHAVLLGVVKEMLSLWFDKEYSKSPWSCKLKIQECDARRAAIKPPDNISRIPRSLEKCRHKYKASEYKTWLLYYSVPVMCGILPEMYLHHYMLLVQSIHILLRDCITDEMVQQSKELLRHFCLRLVWLYGERTAKYNFHQLLHLPFCVENLGPLWASSCFFYEDLNGDMRSLFHGTQSIEKQILQAVSVMQNLPSFEKAIFHNGPAYNLFCRMMHPRRIDLAKCIPIELNLFAMGKPHVTNSESLLCHEHRAMVEHSSGEICLNTIEKLHRVVMKTKIFYSAEYRQMKRRNCYTVLYSDDNREHKVGSVRYFFRYKHKCDVAACVLQTKCICQADKVYHYGAMIWEHPLATPVHLSSTSLKGPLAVLDYMSIVKNALSLAAVVIHPRQILEKLFLVDGEMLQNNFVCRFPNDVEKE